jgi:hypothetical protein
MNTDPADIPAALVDAAYGANIGADARVQMASTAAAVIDWMRDHPAETGALFREEAAQIRTSTRRAEFAARYLTPTHPTPDRVLSHTPINPGGTRGN